MLETNKVYCMDALEGMKQIPDESVDCIITDPPYNTGMNSKSQEGKRLDATKPRLSGFFNDSYTEGEYVTLVNNSCKEFHRVLKNNSGCYIFINWKSYPLWYNELINSGFNIKNCIVWDKEVHGLNYQNYAYRHEFIIFCSKGNFSPIKKTFLYTDVWRIKRRLGNEMNEYGHETVKPIQLIEQILTQATIKGAFILDPFAGTGTTGVACKKLGRKYCLIEIIPEYASLSILRCKEMTEQVSLERLQDFLKNNDNNRQGDFDET